MWGSYSAARIYTSKFWLLCFSSFLFFASFNMILPELPDYLESIGGGAHKGLIIPLFTLMAGFSRPFSGKLTDTIGRIPIMVYGVFVCIICGAMYAVVNGILAFFILRVIHGMSTGFKPTATSAYIGDIAPKSRRGEAMGLFGVFGSIGMAAGPAIGSWLAMHYNYDIMFYASSFSALLSIIVLTGMTETLKERQPFRFSQLKLKITDVYDPVALKPALVMFLVVFPFGVMLTVIPDFTEFVGVSNKGIFFAIFTVSSLIIRIIAGKASDKWGREQILIGGVLLMVASMFILSGTHTIWHLYLAGVVFGFASGINTPTIFAWTIDLADEKHRGRALATVYIAMEIGIGLGGFFSGYFYANRPERFPWVFVISGLVVFAAVVILFVFIRKKQLKLKNI